MLRSASRVEPSPRKFSLDNVPALIFADITLDGLAARNAYDRVCVNGKVIRVNDLVKVSAALTKQDITIADATSATKLTLWEGDSGTVCEDKSYKFSEVVVRTYQQMKYLSTSKEGATIAEIGNIGEEAEDDLPVDDTFGRAEVADVLTLASYLLCLACKSKVEPTIDQMRECTKCN